MTKTNNKYIYFSEDGVLLDRKTAYISCICNDRKEERIVKVNKTKVTFFGKKIKYEEQTVKHDTKYYFNLGDKKWSVAKSNFNYNGLLQEWEKYSKEIVGV